MSTQVVLKGTAASPGVASGKAYLLIKDEVRAEHRTAVDAAAEVQRLEAAIARAEVEIGLVRERTAATVGESEAQVFDAHLMFLSDPALVDTAKDRIQAESECAEWAFQCTGEDMASMLAGLEDTYLRERAADVRDVVDRVLRILLGKPAPTLAGMTEPGIVVAVDLTPSETAQLDRNLVLGFATDIGGPTSHSAIMARTLGLPAVVGLGKVTASVAHGEPVILDGSEGTLVVRPSAAELERFTERLARLKARQARMEQLASLPAETADGRHVELAGNIGKPSEALDALKWGAEGIGLFRTEFLYMDRGTLPSEEEQYQAYRATLEHMGSYPVIIRTLDIGGDKQLAALDMPHEENPFLGVRAIRLCLERQELFKTQLRALLRASVHGTLRIMYPMIQSLQELQAANRLLAEARAELEAEGVPVGVPEVGIMVEIPAAAAIADLLAPHVDFFSIGTNDLIQYTLAIDRMNERVMHLYQPFHPAILRLIRQTCVGGRLAGKWTGMCGEMAGDPVAAPVLLGLGLEEWSMGARSLPAVKEILRATRREDAEALANQLMTMSDPTEIRKVAEAFYRARVSAD